MIIVPMSSERNLTKQTFVAQAALQRLNGVDYDAAANQSADRRLHAPPGAGRRDLFLARVQRCRYSDFRLQRSPPRSRRPARSYAQRRGLRWRTGCDTSKPDVGTTPRGLAIASKTYVPLASLRRRRPFLISAPISIEGLRSLVGFQSGLVSSGACQEGIAGSDG